MTESYGPMTEGYSLFVTVRAALSLFFVREVM